MIQSGFVLGSEWKKEFIYIWIWELKVIRRRWGQLDARSSCSGKKS